jgi:hypothetical protein
MDKAGLIPATITTSIERNFSQKLLTNPQPRPDVVTAVMGIVGSKGMLPLKKEYVAFALLDS